MLCWSLAFLICAGISISAGLHSVAVGFALLALLAVVCSARESHQ